MNPLHMGTGSHVRPGPARRSAWNLRRSLGLLPPLPKPDPLESISVNDRIFGVPRPPTTILLHGFAGSTEDWKDVIGKELDAVALALPGHHPRHPVGKSFHEAVQALHARLPPGLVDIVGYSLGGRLALGLAALDPARVRRLFLLSAHTGLADSDVRAARLARDAAWAEQLKAAPEAFFESFDRLPLFHGPLSARAATWKARRRRHDPTALAHALDRLSTGAMPNFRPRVTGPDWDVTLAVGERDQAYREHYAALAHARPSLAVHVIADASHRVLVDAPDSVGHLINAWVQNEL